MIALSASKIATWLQCPRKFKLRYIVKMPPAWKSSALALGSAVHSSLEMFHQQRAIGATMTPEGVGALFRIDLAAELTDDIRYKDYESAQNLATTGERLVKMYVTANQNVQVHAAEVPFELEILDGVVLRGVFDALLTGDRVRELKTAARDFDDGTLARNVQFSSYAWAYPLLFGRQAVVEVITLLKTKHPRLEAHEVTRSPQEQAWFVEMVAEVARAIETGAFPPSPGWACGDCEYGERCGTMIADMKLLQPNRA